MMKTAHRINAKTAREKLQIKALELATTILEEYLNVEVTLQAQRQTGWAGADAFHAGMYVRSEQLVKINFRNLPGCNTFQFLSVLGHEMRHAYQFQKGWKPVDAKASYQTHVLSNYYSKPIEEDARNHQEAYANIVLQDSRFKDFKNALDIEGELPMKRDQEATYAKIGCTQEEVKVFRNREDKLFYLTLKMVGAKKWTKKVCQKAWDEFREVMIPMEWVMVPVTINDLVS